MFVAGRARRLTSTGPLCGHSTDTTSPLCVLIDSQWRPLRVKRLNRERDGPPAYGWIGYQRVAGVRVCQLALMVALMTGQGNTQQPYAR